MKDASRVRLCLPDPPTPTNKALPRSVRMRRDIFIKWTIASLKNTRSIPEPLIVSLYCWRKLPSLSFKSGYDGIYKKVKEHSNTGIIV